MAGGFGAATTTASLTSLSRSNASKAGGSVGCDKASSGLVGTALGARLDVPPSMYPLALPRYFGGMD